MFNPITIPYGAVMLFNVVKLKPGVTLDDIEMDLGEMCNVVKETYGDDQGGFIGGQVYKFSGFISDEGSVAPKEHTTDDHVAIATYWKSFDQHEKSHADKLFKEKFTAILEKCDETYEVGYEMLWQGVPETVNLDKTA